MANEGLLVLKINPQAAKTGRGLLGAGVGKGNFLKPRASVLGLAPPFIPTSTRLVFGFTTGPEGQDKLVRMGFALETQLPEMWPGRPFPGP